MVKALDVSQDRLALLRAELAPAPHPGPVAGQVVRPALPGLAEDIDPDQAPARGDAPPAAGQPLRLLGVLEVVHRVAAVDDVHGGPAWIAGPAQQVAGDPALGIGRPLQGRLRQGQHLGAEIQAGVVRQRQLPQQRRQQGKIATAQIHQAGGLGFRAALPQLLPAGRAHGLVLHQVVIEHGPVGGPLLLKQVHDAAIPQRPNPISGGPRWAHRLQPDRAP